MANFEWFRSKVSDLASDFERSQVLSELKLAVSSHNASQQKYIAQNLHLELVFDCLNSTEREQVEAACHVLAVLLSSLDPPVVLEQYGANLKRALGHPTARVKEMAISECRCAQLRRAASDGALLPQLCQDELLLTVVGCLANDNIAVAKNASALLIRLGLSAAGLRVLFSPPMLAGLKRTQAQSDILRFRVFELAVLVSEQSPAGLQATTACGLLPALLAELHSPDVLLQLNALELLTRLALRPHGLQYLQQQGILRTLAGRLAAVEDEPLGPLLLPGLIKFFGNMSQSNPKEFFTQYPEMVSALFETFDSSDTTLLGVAMETVGYIATTVEGKNVLCGLGEPMMKAMKKLKEMISCAPTDVRVKALNSLANIVELKPTEQQMQALALTRELFAALGPEPLALVMSVCRQPFPELRLAGLQVLRVLAEQEWGQRGLGAQAGVLEFLMDRAQESNKACKDARYEVVRTMAESPTAESVFGSETVLRLQEFVREGPFYVRTQTEVAIEGAT